MVGFKSNPFWTGRRITKLPRNSVNTPNFFEPVPDEICSQDIYICPWKRLQVSFSECGGRFKEMAYVIAECKGRLFCSHMASFIDICVRHYSASPLAAPAALAQPLKPLYTPVSSVHYKISCTTPAKDCLPIP